MTVTIDGTTGIVTPTGTGDVSVGDDLIFTGTGNRITGDFSNATHANRVLIQTSTTNSNTFVQAIPSGTGDTSHLQVGNSSDPANTALGIMEVSATAVSFYAAIRGTGTYLPMRFYTNNNERMRITTGGNVGIGTDSPSTKLHVSGSGNFAQGIRIQDTSVADRFTDVMSYTSTGPYMWVNNSEPLAIYTGGAERVRIDSSGNLMVGGTGASGRLNSYNPNSGDSRPLFVTNTNAGATPNGSIFIDNANTGTSSWAFLQCFSSTSTVQKAFINGAGTFGSATSTYGGTSDIRIKKDVVDATPKLDDLLKVRVVNYVRTDDENQGKELGVIAQELEQIFPGLVYETEIRSADGTVICSDRKNVKYSVFVPMLIKAVQELSAKNDALETRIAVLENTNV